MNCVEHPEDPVEHVNKGKQRAREPSERTPLLGSSSGIVDDLDAPPPADSHRRLRTTLMTVFLISLSLCILVFVFLALIAWSYASRASNIDPEDVIKNDLVFSGPDRVDVLNITGDGGIWVNVKGSIGVDAGKAIGVGSDQDDGILKDVWKAFGRWSVRTLDRVSVDLTTIEIAADYDPTRTLINLNIPPIELPLTVNPPNDKSWLTRVSMPVLIRPTSNNTLLLHFLKESWQTGSISVRANLGKAVIRGGHLDTDSWRSKFQSSLSNIRTSINMKLPLIPGFPHPGRNHPFPAVSDLITLKFFRVFSESSNLFLHATATVINPAPSDFALSVPSLPFTVSIKDMDQPDAAPVDVASVSTHPFSLIHPNITLYIGGSVLPISSVAFPVLSKFVSRYLSSQDNDVVISSPLLPGLGVEARFPSPNPRPKLLRNVTIHNMKIKPSGSTFLASGTVEARVVLPPGIHVGLDVFRIFPDVLIFDGEVPPSFSTRNHKSHSGHNDSGPPEMPLPDPLPEKAFGHIRPDDWLPSVSMLVDPEGDEAVAYMVSAKVVDVPLEVLPGRQKEFSNFVGKVIFGSEGALAGILGNAAVTVAVDGLPLHGPGNKAGEVVLSDLPFQGAVLVGKKGLFGSEQESESVLKDILRRVKENLPF